MLKPLVFVVLAMIAGSPAVRAQHGPSPAQANTPAIDARQFNFLIGQWELDIRPAPAGLGQRIHGVPKLTGVWKAWRALDGWGIEDELRISDASGNPVNLTHAVRYYDAASKTWKSSTIDVYRGVFSSNSAQLRDGVMTVTTSGKSPDGESYLLRGRFTGATANRFRFVQERSTDNGKSWKDNLTIDARRVAASATR